MKCITRNSAHVFMRTFLNILDVGNDDLSKKNNSTSAPCLLTFYSMAIYYLIVKATRLPATVGWHEGHHL